MANKKEKKVDLKKEAKKGLSALIAETLIEAGYSVNANADEFGFTEGTLVIECPDTDVQVKFITPKAGINKYERLPEEEKAE